ncbi:MAG: transposase [Desulfovibrio sp.]|nr:transposase [Desulfovibrio sp.]
MRGHCYADKGYTSKANRDVVHQKGFKDDIMDKAVRGKKLTHGGKIRNKCISSVRCGIERIFGTFKRCRNFARSRYVGQAKVEQEFFLVALSYNLVRTRNLCFF